ncbi:MAG TPA: hypothetical protein VF857_01710 [Spirochaetota bacterium]
MDNKQTERTDRYIQLPSRVILTKEGLDVVSQSKLPVLKMKNHVGTLCEGIEAKSINAQTLQKMVMNSCIEEVCADLPEFLSYRNGIMSVNALLVYAVLYKKLTPSISDKFFTSPVVKDFNRKNPRNAIINIQQINKKAMDEIIQRQKEHYDALKSEISEEVLKLIRGNMTISEEDRALQTRSLDKFIAWIDLRIWFIYDIIYRTNLKDEMLRGLADMIAKYLNRTQIATHLSNLVMELSQNAERAHFERIVVRNDLTAPGEIDRFLRDKGNRDRAAAIAIKNKELMGLAWNMGAERSTMGTQNRMKITISNYGLMDEMTRVLVNKKMKTDVDGLSIGDFYSRGDDTDRLGAGLGLLYNSYLEDYCHAHGIMYRCNIVPEPKYEKTTVIIEISL